MRRFFGAAFNSRNGNNITFSGDFPEDSASAALPKALNAALVPGVNTDVDTLDFSRAKPLFKDSAPIFSR